MAYPKIRGTNKGSSAKEWDKIMELERNQKPDFTTLNTYKEDYINKMLDLYGEPGDNIEEDGNYWRVPFNNVEAGGSIYIYLPKNEDTKKIIKDAGEKKRVVLAVQLIETDDITDKDGYNGKVIDWKVVGIRDRAVE